MGGSNCTEAKCWHHWCGSPCCHRGAEWNSDSNSSSSDSGSVSSTNEQAEEDKKQQEHDGQAWDSLAFGNVYGGGVLPGMPPPVAGARSLKSLS
mmetsp:Transcript_63067/g.141794  ORF Transcript_63067/g.141794 Transcript_63067/m.141794 type:complete len:94 (-) Transcript_63067:6-287(-)